MMISRLLRMAFEVNSVPLSLTVVQGSPREPIELARPDSGDRGSASGASHLRVSSTTTGVRMRQPSMN
jgi:hypothetical protein